MNFSSAVLKVLLILVPLELFFYRTFTRIGIFIPKSNEIFTIYSIFSEFGYIVYNFLLVSVLIMLIALAYSLLKEKGTSEVLIGISIFALVLENIFMLFFTAQSLTLLFYLTSSIIIILLGFKGVKILKKGEIIFIILLTISFLLYRYYVISHSIYGLLEIPSLPIFSITALSLGELSLPLSVFPLFFSLVLKQGKDLSKNISIVIIALVVVTGFVLFSLKLPSMSSIFTIWTLGYSLAYPLPVYAIAFLFFLIVILKCVRENKLDIATGLLLIFASGYAHTLTYQHFLAILGLLLFIKN